MKSGTPACGTKKTQAVDQYGEVTIAKLANTAVSCGKDLVSTSSVAEHRQMENVTGDQLVKLRQTVVSNNNTMSKDMRLFDLGTFNFLQNDGDMCFLKPRGGKRDPQKK